MRVTRLGCRNLQPRTHQLYPLVTLESTTSYSEGTADLVNTSTSVSNCSVASLAAPLSPCTHRNHIGDNGHTGTVNCD